MASQDDVKSFIEQQRLAGAFDSTGQFSVDLRKAREKSQLATQDTAGTHALFWVQAASTYNPLYLRMQWAAIRMEGDIQFSWDGFRRAALGHPGLDPQMQAMSKALAACATLSEDPPTLVYSRQGQGHFKMQLGSEKISPFTPEAFDLAGILFPRQGSSTQRAEEIRQIERRCGFSPVMLRYENRNLQEENVDGYRGRPPCTALWNTFTHASYLLAMRHLKPLQSRTGILITDETTAPSQIPGGRSNHSVFLVKRDEGCQFGRGDRTLAIPIGLEGPGSVRLIRRGVLIESFEHDLGVPGAWAVACVDHLETDLSGLKLIRDQAFDGLLIELTRQILELAGQALERLEEFRLPEAVEVEARPGLLVRMMLWAFAPPQQAPDGANEARSRDCREEIRRRLERILG